MQFARQDYVEESWRIVDPYLKSDSSVYPYEPQTWGHLRSKKMSRPTEAGTIRTCRFDATGVALYLIVGNALCALTES